MRNLTSGVFEHLKITSTMDAYQRFKYTQRLLKGLLLKKYKTFLEEYKETANGIDEYQRKLGEAKDVTMESF